MIKGRIENIIPIFEGTISPTFTSREITRTNRDRNLILTTDSSMFQVLNTCETRHQWTAQLEIQEPSVRLQMCLSTQPEFSSQVKAKMLDISRMVITMIAQALSKAITVLRSLEPVVIESLGTILNLIEEP